MKIKYFRNKAFLMGALLCGVFALLAGCATRASPAPIAQPIADFEEFGDFRYQTKQDGSVIITEYTGNGPNVDIPAAINGQPVTAIGDYAFRQCDELTGVTIPDGVTSIGMGAFQRCFRLTSIAIPDSVTSIGMGTFQQCSLLASITIPDNAAIEYGAFYSCDRLSNITIGANVQVAEVNAKDGDSFYRKDFVAIYNYNGRIAGTYTWAENWQLDSGQELAVPVPTTPSAPSAPTPVPQLPPEKIFVGGTPPQGTRDSYAAVLPAFNDALDWLDLYTRDGGNYIIVLGSDQAVNNVKLKYGGKRVTVSLTASGGGRMVKCDRNKPSDSLFTVEEGVTFTLEEGVTISGAGITTFERKIGGESSLTLVRVRGRFIMNGGAVRDSDLGYNTDCAVRVFDSGDFTMNAGTISGNHGGGGVWVGGTFTMNGGVISGNTTWAGSNGGGVVVVGTFTMNGGTISENSAFGSSRSGMFMGGNGGSVYVYEGTFTMTGGAINGSSADYGGGIGLAKGATFTMTGGEISGNTARNGGGIYMYDELSTTACTFTMSGGAINGNTARNGGGVYVVTGAFTMKGGDISGNSAVRGNNSSGGSGGGVYVSNSFTMSGGAIGGNSASDNGGGVYVAKGETFTKSGTGGIVYGSNAPAGQANKAPSDAAGHAVYVDGDRPQKRVTTAGETTALDSRKNLVAGGGWE